LKIEDVFIKEIDKLGLQLKSVPCSISRHVQYIRPNSNMCL